VSPRLGSPSAAAQYTHRAKRPGNCSDADHLREGRLGY
jgi:hypothetical protein